MIVQLRGSDIKAAIEAYVNTHLDNATNIVVGSVITQLDDPSPWDLTDEETYVYVDVEFDSTA